MKCQNCNDEFAHGLNCFYADLDNGFTEKHICTMCYVKHLIQYYPGSKIIPYEIERMEIVGVDTLGLLIATDQPTLFEAKPEPPEVTQPGIL